MSPCESVNWKTKFKEVNEIPNGLFHKFVGCVYIDIMKPSVRMRTRLTHHSVQCAAARSSRDSGTRGTDLGIPPGSQSCSESVNMYSFMLKKI